MDTIDNETGTDTKPAIEITNRRTMTDAERVDFTHALFGLHFPMNVEPTIFAMADRISPDYSGGYWQFYALSGGGFYMAPDSAAIFRVVCENGFEGDLSADALGIAACLYAYSHLSFMERSVGGHVAEVCAGQYHLLRDYAMDHAEAGAILAAID